MNVWNFTGNLGKDCEVTYSKSGEAICTFSVAVTSGYGDKKKTTWPKCVLFGKAASGQLPQYLTQGTQVAVSGEVCLDEWEKEGVKNKMLKVIVSKVDLIGQAEQRKSSNDQRNQQQAPTHDDQMTRAYSPQEIAAARNPNPHNPAPQGFDEFDDDIPF